MPSVVHLRPRGPQAPCHSVVETTVVCLGLVEQLVGGPLAEARFVYYLLMFYSAPFAAEGTVAVGA